MQAILLAKIIYLLNGSQKLMFPTATGVSFIVLCVVSKAQRTPRFNYKLRYFGTKVMPIFHKLQTHMNYSVPTDYSQFDKGKSTSCFHHWEKYSWAEGQTRLAHEKSVRKSTAGLTAPPMGFRQLPVTIRLALPKFTAFQKDEAHSLFIIATI